GHARERQGPPARRAARQRGHHPRRGARRRNDHARRGRAGEGEGGPDERGRALPRRDRNEGSPDALSEVHGRRRRGFHGVPAVRPRAERRLQEVRAIAAGRVAVLPVLHDEHERQAHQETAARPAQDARAASEQRGRVQEHQSLRTFYELLSVPRDASTDDIKKAFRREIARYHPDKVQHLGQEFQDLAAGIAADLTEAYRILMDPTLRAKYDEDLVSGGPGIATSPPPGPSARPEPSAPHVATSAATAPPPPPRQAPGAGIDFVRKASLSRLRDAIGQVLAGSETLAV